MIERSIGIGRGGLSVLKKIHHMRIGIHVVEIRLLLFRCRNCCVIGCGRLRRRVGGVNRGQASEKEDGQIWEWGFHIKERESLSFCACCVRASAHRRPEAFAGAKVLVPV